MRIRTLVLGAYQTNSYVLRADDASDECVVVDTGLGAEALTTLLQTKSLTPKALILTHGHGDHIAGAPELLALWPEMIIYAHQLEAEVLLDPNLNLTTMTGMPMTLDGEIHYVVQDQIIQAARITLKVLHTPGHTPGGMSLYGQEKGVVFSGDTLFADSVGRTDFPGGSQPVLIQSVREQLFVLPDNTRVYPGHGPSTTIGHEKLHNPYVR